MEQIVIEVTDEAAKQWNEAPPQVKARLQKIGEEQRNDVARQRKITEFKERLDRMGEQTKANGLTEEILQKLLDEE